MSDNTNTVGMQEFSVTRNNVSLTFAPTTITRESKLGKGTVYPSVVVNKENVRQVAEWCGDDVLISLLGGKLKQRCQNWYAEATVQEDGKTPKDFDQSEFVKYAEEFSARGETIKELIEEQGELTLELTNALTSGRPDALQVAQQIADRIKIIMTAINNKKRERNENKEAAPVTV